MHEPSTLATPQDGLAAEAAGQFLSFRVDGEEYAVDIMSVREIKGWSTATRLPNSPDHLRGVMNLRGLILPIFDLRCRFGQGLTQATDKHVVIILAVGERQIGVLVDAVSDILTVADSSIRPAPEIDSEHHTPYVAGLISYQDRMVALLDLSILFGQEATASYDSH